MRISRRSLLKGAVAVGATTTVAGRAEAREKREVEAEAVGMLHDSTLCIGCRACVTKCKEANGLPYDHSADGLYDQPDDLNGNTKNVIKVLSAEGGQYAFMKQQCMHCVDPSCVSVCMMGALHKEGEGTRRHPGRSRAAASSSTTRTPASAAATARSPARTSSRSSSGRRRSRSS